MAADNDCQWRLQRRTHNHSGYTSSTCRLRRVYDRDLDLYQHLCTFDYFMHQNIHGNGSSGPGDQQTG